MVRYEDELNEDLIRMEETLQSYQKQQIRSVYNVLFTFQSNIESKLKSRIEFKIKTRVL